MAVGQPWQNRIIMNEAETFTFRTADLLIEQAPPGDYERVGELTAQSYFAAGHFETPEHDYLQFVRKVQERAEQSEIYVARRQGEIIGSMTLIQVGSDYADIALPGELEIRMLSVDPAAQRAGVGRALVNASIERARRLPGIHSVSLTTGATWHSARSLYESMDFAHAPQRDWTIPGTGIKLVVYTLEL